MKRFIATAIALALLLSIVGCGSSDNSTAATDVHSSPPITDTDEASKSDKSDVQNATPAGADTEPTEASPTEIIGIPGSYMGDVTAALKQTSNLPIGAISPASGRDGYYTISMINIPELGISFDYSISCDTEYQITLAMFNYTGDTGDSEYRDLGKGFLSYCSSLYYDTADADAAQAWVADNFGNIADAPETTIGDAYFRMENTGDIFTLIVKVADYDEQSANLAS